MLRLAIQQGRARAATASIGRFIPARALSTNLSVPGQTNPGADLTDELKAKAIQRNEDIRKKHEELPESLDVRRKRLIWRSKQRGWLEVDMLMGTWAVDNVPKLTKEELDQYEHLLNLETLDLFNVVSKEHVIGVPENIQGPLLERIRKYARGFKSDPEAYAKLIKPKMAN